MIRKTAAKSAVHLGIEENIIMDINETDNETEPDEIRDEEIEFSSEIENVTPTAPVCEFYREVINGVISFRIPNVGNAVVDTGRAFGMDTGEDKWFSDWNMHLFISFSNKTWHKFTRSLWPHKKGHKFFIKVPFTLRSYFVAIKIQLQHKERLNYISPFSDEYTIKIASFLIQPKLKIGELIQYRLKNATFVGCAKILETLENDEYKIQDCYPKNGIKEIHTVNRNDIFQDVKSLHFLIDTCSLLDENGMNLHRYNAECDLILKTKNEKFRNYYWMLRNIIASVINIKFACDNDATAAHVYNFNFVGGLLSQIITEYLYFDQICGDKREKNSIINYKVRCFVNSSHMDASSRTVDGYDIVFMYMDNHWKYEIENSLAAYKHGHENQDIQLFNLYGWSCDLCRCEINVCDWMYHCIPRESIACNIEGHCYCLQCVYSMTNGIVAFEKSLAKIVHKYIDQNFTMDCIKEIVALTVGNASIQIL